MNEKQNILEIRDLSKSFPGVQALDGVSFDINRGEIHSIVGENGAGKSTLTKVIAGLYERDNGRIAYDGREVNYKNMEESIEDAIYVVFQELSLCTNLSVAENIYLGKLQLKFKGSRGLVNRKTILEEAERHLASLNITGIPVGETVENLEVAQQQLVEIAKALVMKPRLLILDEPTSALTEDEVKNLFILVNRLREEGVTIILISHIIEDVFAYSDSITVLRDGQHIVTKPKTEFDIPEIVRQMVGREVKQVEIGRLETDDVLMSVSDLNSRLLKDVNLTLRKGEILGLMGLQGSGNADLLRCIYGKQKYEGTIRIDGTDIRIRNSVSAIRNGVVYVPADRKNEGLLDTLDIGYNLSFQSLNNLHTWGLVNRRRVYENASRLASQLRLKFSSLERSPFTLSGGNQQKVVIGKALSVDPNIILLDDPTRGVDIGAKSEIYKIMVNMAESGRGILFLSTELPELLSLCHRILVFFNGRIVGEFDREDATEEKLVGLACGLEHA